MEPLHPGLEDGLEDGSSKDRKCRKALELEEIVGIGEQRTGRGGKCLAQHGVPVRRPDDDIVVSQHDDAAFGEAKQLLLIGAHRAPRTVDAGQAFPPPADVPGGGVVLIGVDEEFHCRLVCYLPEGAVGEGRELLRPVSAGDEYGDIQSAALLAFAATSHGRIIISGTMSSMVSVSPICVRRPRLVPDASALVALRPPAGRGPVPPSRRRFRPRHRIRACRCRERLRGRARPSGRDR